MHNAGLFISPTSKFFFFVEKQEVSIDLHIKAVRIKHFLLATRFSGLEEE